MKIDRGKNTVRNIGWGTVNKVVLLLLPFVIRTAILRTLGEQYLGLSSLFTSILQVLNMAELGFSSAVVFSMYKPIAADDHETICALMAYYRKIYRIVGMVVLGGGLCVLPFLSFLIKGTHPADINIYLLYCIYLLNSALSYFLFSYQNSLLSAYQRNDITSKIGTVVSMLQYVIQIVILFVFKNYYAYIIFAPIFTIVNNLITNAAAKKNYPQIRCRGKLDGEIKQQINKQVKGLMVSKICGTLRNSLDSIVLSSFIGLSIVAVYGNYYYILSSIHGLLTIIGVSMKAGVGNSIAKENADKNYRDFNKFTLMYMWIAGWCAVCLLCLYQPFMLLWTKKADMLFSMPVVILFCFYFFFECAMDMRNVYMDSVGLWWEARYRSIIECVANLVLNLTLVLRFGAAGILIATIITLTTVNLGYGTKILFDNYFKDKSTWKYLLRVAAYALVSAVSGAATYYLCSFVPVGGFLELILRGIICCIVPNIIFLLAYMRLPEFGAAKQYVLGFLGRKKQSQS